MKKLLMFWSLLLLVAGMETASASPITLDLSSSIQTVSGEALLAVPGPDKYQFAASATFTLTPGSSSNTFTLVLANTSTQAVTDPAQLLSAIFWNSSTPLTPVAAALTSDRVWVNPQDVALNVGGNYSYNGALRQTGVDPAPTNQGVSAVGIGLFGNGNFGGKPVPADGDAYTILPPAGIAGKGNAFNNKYPLADNSMTFTFYTTANAISIDDVIFHYSSGYEGVNLAAVMPSSDGGGNNPHAPLPPTAFLLGSGLLGLGLLGFRKKSQA
jgi:hypothetical protein